MIVFSRADINVRDGYIGRKAEILNQGAGRRTLNKPRCACRTENGRVKFAVAVVIARDRHVARRGYRFTEALAENFEEEIIIERESVERRFVAEVEVSDDALKNPADDSFRIGQIKPLPLFEINLRPAYLLLAVGLLIAVAFLVWPRLEGYFSRNGSEKTFANGTKLNYERLSVSGRVYHVGLSPNDQYAAYSIYTAESKYSLLLQHLPTGSETVVLDSQETSLESIQFSPDGNYIYYLARHAAKHLGVYRIPLSGGRQELITQEPVDYFSLSPDGQWLAYFRRNNGISHFLEICRSHDGSERRIVVERGGLDFFSIWGVAPVWSPDGRKLVASAFSRTEKGAEPKNFLVEIDVADGTQTRIKTPDWHRVHQARWSGDGAGLFVLVREKAGDAQQIWQVSYPSGEARNITNDSNDYRQFAISSDAEFMTAISWTRTENLFLIPLENPAQTRQLTFDTASVNGSSGIKWTPDGKEIFFAKGRSSGAANLFKLNPETLETRQLTNDENLSPDYLDIAPDGRTVVFASNRMGFWNLWRIDPDGANLRQMTFGKGEKAPEISPDGQWLYYIGDGLWKMPLVGGEAIRIWGKTPGTTRVSPANPKQLISYFHDRNEKIKNPWMFVLYSEDRPDEFVNLNINSIIHFEWKPDGGGIYFADPGEGFNNIWFLSLKDLKTQKITDFTDQRIANLSLSPDGKTLVVSRGPQNSNIVKISGF